MSCKDIYPLKTWKGFVPQRPALRQYPFQFCPCYGLHRLNYREDHQIQGAQRSISCLLARWFHIRQQYQAGSGYSGPWHLTKEEHHPPGILHMHQTTNQTTIPWRAAYGYNLAPVPLYIARLTTVTC